MLLSVRTRESAKSRRSSCALLASIKTIERGLRSSKSLAQLDRARILRAIGGTHLKKVWRVSSSQFTTSAFRIINYSILTAQCLEEENEEKDLERVEQSVIARSFVIISKVSLSLPFAVLPVVVV